MQRTRIGEEIPFGSPQPEAARTKRRRESRVDVEAKQRIGTVLGRDGTCGP
jgi:hypothetical protein